MNCGTWPEIETGTTHHNTKWGVPAHDGRVLFEFLILKRMPSGSSPRHRRLSSLSHSFARHTFRSTSKN